MEAAYDNVEVYITKSKQTENPSIKNRVAFAKEKNAAVLVSQHINSTSAQTTTASGVLAIVPTVDATHAYNYEAALEAQSLGRFILDELVALGFADKGFTYRLSGDNTRYPDGSLADYYGIVKYSREASIPGVIIEHGFCNNEADAKMLADEAMLQKIGAADAIGIANHLGLEAVSVPDLPEEGSSLGDVNEDGKRNVRDVMKLKEYLSDPDSVTINLSNGDLDENGKINVRDVMRLKEILAYQ